MIRYATLHYFGFGRPRSSFRRNFTHVLKYFDPCEPLERYSAEYVGYTSEPKIKDDTVLIKAEDGLLYEWTKRHLTSDMITAVQGIMFNSDDIGIWRDLWSDAGFYEVQVYGELINHEKLLLFAFWHVRGIPWTRKLFMECFPTSIRPGVTK